MDIQINVPAQIISIPSADLMAKIPEADVIAWLTGKGYTVTKTVTPPPPPPPPPANPITIITHAIPKAKVGVPYSTTLEATSTAGAITSWMTVDTLGNPKAFATPSPGLSWGGVNSQIPGLTISGTPTLAATISFRFKVTDALGNTVTTDTITLAIDAPDPVTPPPPPVVGKGKLYFGSSWPSTTTVAAQLMAKHGLTPAQCCIVNKYVSAITPWAGPKIFGQWNFQSTKDTANGTGKDFAGNAQDCINAGINIIRLAWEFNTGNPADAYSYFTGKNPAGFISRWRYIYTEYSKVAVSNGLPSDHFSFIFNPDKGTWSPGNTTPITQYYPGKEYMGNPGVIGLDFYTDRAAPPGQGQIDYYNKNMAWSPKAVVDLATLNGHDISIPEWSNRGDAYGENFSDPNFITAIVDWANAFIKATGRNAYLATWDYGYPNQNNLWVFHAAVNQISIDALTAKVAALKSTGIFV